MKVMVRRVTLVGIMLSTLCEILPAAEENSVTVVKVPDTQTPNAFYISNRAPLRVSPFAKLPVGSIRAKGWLHKQLILQADGLCGHLPNISAFVKKEGNAWLSDKQIGRGSWEEVPYWLKGYSSLAFLLEREAMITETREWVDAVIQSQRKSGWFGPFDNLASFRSLTSMEGVQVLGRADQWPNALMLNTLRTYYEYTNDERVLALMRKYFHWLLEWPEQDTLIHWEEKRRGIELLKSIFWFYNLTGDKWLLDLAHKIHRRSNDWTSGISRYHGVDVAQCFYEPALYGLLGQDPNLLKAGLRNYQTIYDNYGQVPGGMFAADERFRPGFTGARQCVETCAMVEMMSSCQTLLTSITGEVKWADRCEDVAFNSLPAALTADMKGVRYLTAPNLVRADSRSKFPDVFSRGPMLLMNPHDHRCCQHNHSQGWPYFVEHLWLATADNGLAATLYSACEVQARVGQGQNIHLSVDTHYPFAETVTVTLEMDRAIRFPLYLRVPTWCRQARLKINGKHQSLETRPGTYLRVARTWEPKDRIELTLGMDVRICTWARNDNTVSVMRGPLTYSLKITEVYKRLNTKGLRREKTHTRDDVDYEAWPAWEIRSGSAWNYGLDLDASPEAQNVKVEQRPWPKDDMPFTHLGTPILLKAPARRIPNWKIKSNGVMGDLYPGPIRTDTPIEEVTLIPMGAARLRVSAFPVIGTGPEAQVWPSPDQQRIYGYKQLDGTLLTVSYHDPRSRPAVLVDGHVPLLSNDSLSRMMFWPHKGTDEWVQWDFPEKRTVIGVEAFWFDDTGRGGCRVPADWQASYRRGDQWTPLPADTGYDTYKDHWNQTQCRPVLTNGIRLEIQLQHGYSGGLHEVRILTEEKRESP